MSSLNCVKAHTVKNFNIETKKSEQTQCVCSDFSVQFVQTSLYSLFRVLCTVCSEFSV